MELKRFEYDKDSKDTTIITIYITGDNTSLKRVAEGLFSYVSDFEKDMKLPDKAIPSLVQDSDIVNTRDYFKSLENDFLLSSEAQAFPNKHPGVKFGDEKAHWSEPIGKHSEGE